jgi:dihydrofolate reductase
MQPIIYDVAVSLDGFISGPEGDISAFAHDGPVVKDYRSRLSRYSTAIMGRRTYEFGYAYGLAPGANPYPHMETIVFSRTLNVPGNSEVSVVSGGWLDRLAELKSKSKAPIYLCGGGMFAAWLLEHGLIDQLVLKRAPHVYGGGVRLFGDSAVSARFERVATAPYDNGYLLERLSLA